MYQVIICRQEVKQIKVSCQKVRKLQGVGVGTQGTVGKLSVGMQGTVGKLKGLSWEQGGYADTSFCCQLALSKLVLTQTFL